MTLESILKEIEADVDEAGKFVEGAFVGLFKAEVTNALTAVKQVLPTFAQDIASAAATGQLSSLGGTLGHVITAAATQLENSSIVVGIDTLATVAGQALAAVPAVAAMPSQAAATAAKATDPVQDGPAPTPPAPNPDAPVAGVAKVEDETIEDEDSAT